MCNGIIMYWRQCVLKCKYLYSIHLIEKKKSICAFPVNDATFKVLHSFPVVLKVISEWNAIRHTLTKMDVYQVSEELKHRWDEHFDR